MFDVIIVGAGPAGLMCANNLKTDNYIVLEKKCKPLNKLLISGNGRCNLTNKKSNNEFLEVLEYNKKYLYSTINLFGPFEVFNYFSKSIKLKEERDNKVFPLSDNAKDVYNVLVKDVDEKILCNSVVREIKKEGDFYGVYTQNEVYKCKCLVIAVGGASFPHTGSEGDHVKFSKSLGQECTKLYPAETSVLLEENFAYANGISIDNVCVMVRKKKFFGNFLFTNSGLSGSAIMNASGFIAKENIKEIYVNFLPNEDVLNIINSSLDKEVTGAFNLFLTKKLINVLFSDKDFFHKKMRSLSIEEKLFIVNEISNKKFMIKKVNDLKYAYVTGGGIDLNFLNTKTFESKTSKDLYFIGECLDVHGPIGGYNITLALSTGYSASENINKMLKK